ncbi:MAG: putative HTH-type transcriptional regulator YusO [Syntrophorhabdus sp. PtaU1.Bin153]|nr:MAG: putative HTH-type transcriptional regulator YusO [Syntrophorhabdus sp. PtaU1.Bin153]
MPHLDPYESLGFHCGLTFKAFIGSVERKLKGTGVSPAQFLALAHLVALGPLSQSELVDRLSITKATGVRLVDRMERDGWVAREADPKDGRVKRVVATQRAIEIWERVSKAGREVLDQAYRGVHTSEIETVKRVLERVRRNLS